MDRFAAMQAFARVVELGSFTKAASSLNMPKGTLSTLVQALESSLRVRLLNRTTRHVSVTPDGAAYYERAVRILTELEETEAAISDATAAPKGRLRADVPASLGRLVIVPALEKFFAKYPDIQLELGCSDRPVDLIEEGVDCVVRGGDLIDSTLVARRVAELRVVTCATPAYLERHGRPIVPQDLEQHTVINFFSAKTGKIYDFDFAKDGKKYSITGRHKLAVDDSQAYLEAGLAGLGIMRGVTTMVQDHIAAGRLEVVLGEYLSDGIPVYVMYPQNRHLSNKVRVFVEWIAELFADNDLMQARSTIEGLQRGKVAAIN